MQTREHIRRASLLSSVALAVVACGSTWHVTSRTAGGGAQGASAGSSGGIPTAEIGAITGLEPHVVNGVLALDLARDDLGEVRGPRGVTFDGSFQLDGDLFFQPLEDGRAFLNGDIPLTTDEVNPFIASIVRHGVQFQALHQHFPMEPQIWFVHFRGAGDAVELARAMREAFDTTSMRARGEPAHAPGPPLDADRLARILHGHARTGASGVVTVWVYRRAPVSVGGVVANPQANVSTNVELRSLAEGQAAVVPDIAMTASEVNPVVGRMLGAGWYQGCLYNQETGEHPQLYFDHMSKTGDPYELAREIRRGLDLTDAE